MSFVDVLPVEPVIADDARARCGRARRGRARRARRTRRRGRASPRRRARARRRRSPTPPPTATKRSPGSMRRESIWTPVTSSAPGARSSRPARALGDLVERERDHARGSEPRAAPRARPRGRRTGSSRSASSCPCSWPLPAITTTSPAPRAARARARSRRARSSSTSDLAGRPRRAISSMIACGSSLRGLSEVTIATSASSDGDPAHQRPLAAVAVAAAAEDADHAAARRARAPCASTFSSASGVCA